VEKQSARVTLEHSFGRMNNETALMMIRGNENVFAVPIACRLKNKINIKEQIPSACSLRC